MATITWNVSSLERTLPDGPNFPNSIVTAANWEVIVEDQGETARGYGSICLPEPEPEKFVPYSSLKKEEVIEWVKAGLGEERVNGLEQALKSEIQGRLTPQSAQGVPW